jgi:hypothetical protein
MNETTNARPTLGEIKTLAKESWASRRAWLVILLFSLGFSAWSLFTMARSMGAPVWLAVGASTVFDGAAIVLGDQAHRARLEGDSALQERLTVAALVGCSAWLNWQHAAKVGWGSFGLLPAAAPVVAEVLFELRTKFAHRAHLRAQGLVAPRLVPLGRWSWMVFPGRSWTVVKSQISGRLDAIETAAGTGELLMSGGWLQVEAKAEKAFRPASGAAGRDDRREELPAAPRPALPSPAAASGIDLSGVFRLTPVAEAGLTPEPVRAWPASPAVSETGVGDGDGALTAGPAGSGGQVAQGSGSGSIAAEAFAATSVPESPVPVDTVSEPSQDEVNTDVSDSLVQGVNGRRRVSAAHSKPARRANQVTARVAGGVDWDEAKRIWHQTTAPDGGRLSSRKLANLTGLSQSTCNRIITEAKAETAA